LERAHEIAFVVRGLVDKGEVIFAASRRPPVEVEAPEVDPATV
jgi:hypothetical protein